MARQEEEDVEEDGEKAELWMEDDSKRIHPLLGKIKNKKNSKSQRSLSVGGSSAGDPEVLTAVSTTPVSVDEGVHLKLLVKSVVIGMCVCACVCVCRYSMYKVVTEGSNQAEIPIYLRTHGNGTKVVLASSLPTLFCWFLV